MLLLTLIKTITEAIGDNLMPEAVTEAAAVVMVALMVAVVIYVVAVMVACVVSIISVCPCMLSSPREPTLPGYLPCCNLRWRYVFVALISLLEFCWRFLG